MDSISSANVACGFHAGDPARCGRPSRWRSEKGVAVGAHPGFQDLVGFGRREMKATPAGGRGPRALPGVGAGRHGVGPGRAAAARQGARRALQHGVPRSRARRGDREGRGRPRSIARSCSAAELGMLRAGRGRGTPRRGGSVCRSRLRSGRLTDLARETRQRHSRHARRSSSARSGWCARRQVIAVDGSTIALQADTICLHGDTPVPPITRARCRRVGSRRRIPAWNVSDVENYGPEKD